MPRFAHSCMTTFGECVERGGEFGELGSKPPKGQQNCMRQVHHGRQNVLNANTPSIMYINARYIDRQTGTATEYTCANIETGGHFIKELQQARRHGNGKNKRGDEGTRPRQGTLETLPVNTRRAPSHQSLRQGGFYRRDEKSLTSAFTQIREFRPGPV